MQCVLDWFCQKQQERLQPREDPPFRAGDTVCVHVRISEGARQRIQKFEGVCIARKGSGVNASFVVRRVAAGVGTERFFPVMSPTIVQIECLRRGRVRRAKLYYLRERSGKSARIPERITRK